MSDKLLSKKDLRRVYVNWLMFSMSCQNMERMQAPGFARCMGIVADKLYDDKEEQKQLMLRHTQFFNTQPSMGVIIPGIILGMEEQRAMGKDVPDELIGGMKTALMGPFAGIGDSLIDGTLIPILLSIALGLSKDTGSIAGPIFYSVAFLAIVIPLSWFLFSRGYSAGLESTEMILASGKKDVITKAANLVGLIVIGAISAQYVAANIGLSYASGDMAIEIQPIIDSLFPSLLPLLLTIMSWLLLDKKDMKIGWVFFIFIVIAVVGSLTGFLVP